MPENARFRGGRRFVLLGALALPLAWLSPAVASDLAASADAWPLFRGNLQHTGRAATMLPDQPTVLWTREFGEAIGSTAAIVDGVVYVGCDDGKLRALKLADGADTWSYEAKSPIRSAPSVIDGVVYFGDDEGMLHAVDTRSQKARWTFDTGDQIISAAIPLTAQNAPASAPAATHASGANTRIVFGSYDGFVYCLSAADGQLAWKFETAGKVHGTPGLTPAGQRLIVAGCDEFLHILDAANGTEITKIPAGSPTGSSAAIAGDRVYIGTYGQQVLGLDWRKGDVLWRFEDPERQFPYVSSPAITGNAVVIGGRDKRLHCLDANTGQERWAFVARGRIDSSPVIVGDERGSADRVKIGERVVIGENVVGANRAAGAAEPAGELRVFVGASDGNLYALSLADGREVWRYEAGGPITASPAVAANRLVVGTEDGVLYCFGEKSK